jgi:3-oxoadipate enol-lactonase
LSVGRTSFESEETMIRVAFALTVLLFVPDSVRTGRTKTGIMYDVQGSGPAVVLITGSNLDRRMWTAEAGWLKSQFTVIRYDLRAHGQSDVPTVPFSHVNDLFEVLDDLRIDRAALIGLSAGSTIALDAVLQAPDRIASIVLVAPGISGYSPKERPAFFAPLIAALQARDYGKAAEVMLASPIFEVPDSARALVRSMVTENDRLWTVPRELMKLPDRPAVERLEEIRAPALVLVGDRDLAAQREQADVLGRRISGAHLLVVPGGGHMLNLTSAAAFRDAVSRFLVPEVTEVTEATNGGYGGNGITQRNGVTETTINKTPLLCFSV